jgi:biopolymer transport protein ExbD
VFQLLTFFLMTFRVAAAEGDFNVMLPRDRPDQPGGAVAVEEIRIRVTATSGGDLQSVQIDAQPAVTGRNAASIVHADVVRLVALARNHGLEAPPVVLDADDHLRFEHLLQIVAAISQQTDAAGNVVPLARKVRFAAPR